GVDPRAVHSLCTGRTLRGYSRFGIVHRVCTVTGSCDRIRTGVIRNQRIGPGFSGFEACIVRERRFAGGPRLVRGSYGEPGRHGGVRGPGTGPGFRGDTGTGVGHDPRAGAGSVVERDPGAYAE